jgi:hypothetical protein
MASFRLKVQGGEDMSLPCCSVGLLEDWLFLLLIENSYTIVDCHWQSSTQWGLLSFSAIDLFPPIFICESVSSLNFVSDEPIFFGLNFFMVYTVQALLFLHGQAPEFDVADSCCTTFFFHE